MNLYDTDIWREMKSGRIYEATHPALIAELKRMRGELWELNQINPLDEERLYAKFREILGFMGSDVMINLPFRCDYGKNISIGDYTIINFNITILDEADVNIGKHVFIGPNVSLYTPCHPTEPELRNSGCEWSLPITIEDNVWIGGSTTILPGVTIGEGSTIGAGSVVARSIPPRSIAVGNPCKVIKTAP